MGLGRATGGGALRLLETFLYALLFCCAAIILGIYSYFLSVLANRNLPISKEKKATEGISGAAVLYLIFAVLLTCFLGGIPFLAFIAIVLDVLFVGGFIALAWFTRHGASSCKGNVVTPLGSGPANSGDSGYGSNGFGFGSGNTATYFPKLGLACRLNTASFAVSIIGAVLFLVAALLQVALVRHHKKEKRFGPSPANNYTSGSGNRKFWQRKPKNDDSHLKRDTELGAIGAAGLAAEDHHKHKDIRPSHDTTFSGSTAGPTGDHHYKRDAEVLGAGAVGGEALHHHHEKNKNNVNMGGAHGGYYTQPQGTGINPYGYDNAAQTSGTTGIGNAQTTGTTGGRGTYLDYK